MNKLKQDRPEGAYLREGAFELIVVHQLALELLVDASNDIL